MSLWLTTINVKRFWWPKVETKRCSMESCQCFNNLNINHQLQHLCNVLNITCKSLSFIRAKNNILIKTSTMWKRNPQSIYIERITCFIQKREGTRRWALSRLILLGHTLTPSQARAYRLNMPSLLPKKSFKILLRFLVKIYANWLDDAIWGVDMTPF